MLGVSSLLPSVRRGDSGFNRSRFLRILVVVYKLLTLFDQAHVLRENRHALLMDEREVPECYREVVRRLQRAMRDPKVVDEMKIEDEGVAARHGKDRQLEATDKAIEAKDKAIAEAMAAKDEALAAAVAKDKELEEARKLIQALEAERATR